MDTLRNQIIDQIFKLLAPLRTFYKEEIEKVTNDLLNNDTKSFLEFVNKYYSNVSNTPYFNEIVTYLANNNLINSEFLTKISVKNSITQVSVRPLNVKVRTFNSIKANQDLSKLDQNKFPVSVVTIGDNEKQNDNVQEDVAIDNNVQSINPQENVTLDNNVQSIAPQENVTIDNNIQSVTPQDNITFDNNVQSVTPQENVTLDNNVQNVTPQENITLDSNVQTVNPQENITLDNNVQSVTPQENITFDNNIQSINPQENNPIDNSSIEINPNYDFETQYKIEKSDEEMPNFNVDFTLPDENPNINIPPIEIPTNNQVDIPMPPQETPLPQEFSLPTPNIVSKDDLFNSLSTENQEENVNEDNSFKNTTQLGQILQFPLENNLSNNLNEEQNNPSINMPEHTNPFDNVTPVVFDKQEELPPEEPSIPIEPQKTEEELRMEIEEKVRDSVRDEVKEELREEVRDSVKNEVKEEVREEVRNEVRDSVRNDVKEELREEVRDSVKNEVKEEVREEVRNEVRDSVRNEVKEELREEVRDSVKNEVKEEVKNEVRDSVRNEVKEEVKEEVEAKVRASVRNEVKAEVEQELRVQMLDKIREETKQNILKLQNDYMNNASEFIKNLDSKPESEIYSSLRFLNDLRYMNHCITHLSPQTLERLYLYIERKLNSSDKEFMDTIIEKRIKDILPPNLSYQIEESVHNAGYKRAA